MERTRTKVVKIGNRLIGGGNPILIQSMTNTKTEQVEATVAQIRALEAAGCDIIRCAVPTMEAAEALKEIRKRISIPLVADIHFDYKLALAAIRHGADQVRINPGNIGSRERVRAVMEAAGRAEYPYSGRCQQRIAGKGASGEVWRGDSGRASGKRLESSCFDRGYGL